MKNIKIFYPVITSESLIVDIDDLINSCSTYLVEEKGEENLTKDSLIEEFYNNCDYFLEKVGFEASNYDEGAWDVITDETYEAFKDRVDELTESL